MTYLGIEINVRQRNFIYFRTWARPSTIQVPTRRPKYYIIDECAFVVAGFDDRLSHALSIRRDDRADHRSERETETRQGNRQDMFRGVRIRLFGSSVAVHAVDIPTPYLLYYTRNTNTTCSIKTPLAPNRFILNILCYILLLGNSYYTPVAVGREGGGLPLK